MTTSMTCSRLEPFIQVNYIEVLNHLTKLLSFNLLHTVEMCLFGGHDVCCQLNSVIFHVLVF